MLNITQRELLKLAPPILLTQIFLILVPMTDTICAGHYSVSLLAGISIGSSIYVTTYVALMGIIQVFNTLFSNAHGAKQTSVIQHLHGQAYLLIAALSLCGSLLLNAQPFWIYLTQRSPELQKLLIPYLQIMSYALPPALFIRFGTTYLNTLGKPWHALLVAFFYFLFKMPISVFLIYKISNNDLQAIQNCALSSIITNWATALILFLLIQNNKKLIPYRPTWPNTLYCGETIKKILRLGGPNAIVYCIQSTSFYIINLLIIPLGVEQIGAHQIGSNIMSLIYMGSISLGSATTIIIAHQKGAYQHRQIHQTRTTSLRTALLCGVLLAFLMVHFSSLILRLFTNNQAVGEIAKTLISIISLFQIADWISIVQYSIIKGLEQTFWPMMVYFFCLWGIGITSGYFLTFSLWGKEKHFPYQGVHIFWLSCTIGLIIGNILLHICYRMEMKKLDRIPQTIETPMRVEEKVNSPS